MGKGVLHNGCQIMKILAAHDANRAGVMPAMAANCCVLPVCVYTAEHLLGAFLFDTPRARPEDRVPIGTITMVSKAEVRVTSSVICATQLA